MDWYYFLIPALILAFAIPGFLRSIRKRKAERDGNMMSGTVRSIVAVGKSWPQAAIAPTHCWETRCSLPAPKRGE